ncbi:MAG: DUF2520 domain-containing protein [candidate division WOR-3 bacterium]|nr:DUF2520 domain-containing protein [candidate division WOR-3 bacterium]
MRIGLIGCGRVGVSITRLLKYNNQIVGMYDRNKGKQRQAVKLLNITNNPDYWKLIDQSEVLLIATPDDIIPQVCKKMIKSITGTKYVFHFSGSLPADIIPKKKNIHRASVHPFATFPKKPAAAGRQHFFLSIEGDPQAIRVARMIFHERHFTLRKIKKENKPIYHLIGVFSSNLLVGLVASINELAAKIGWRRQELEQMIIPMIEETTTNIKILGVQNSLSGPLRRGDVEVIRKHLRALRKDKNLLEIYKALSRTIVDTLIEGKQKRELKKLLR